MMASEHSPDLAAIEHALDAAERDAHRVSAGLTDEQSSWRAAASSWSVAECIDHLATANRVYLAAMQPSAERALARRQARHRPARPGLIGRWFVRTLEPPVRARFKLKAPAQIRPRSSPPLSDALTRFVASQNDVRAFIARYADVDLASIRFPNPFVRGVRFSLATGLHVIAAHERRHLWQAWNVRAAAERARFGHDDRVSPESAYPE